jgi:hypothetical protein
MIKVQLAVGLQGWVDFPEGKSFYLTEHDLLIIEDAAGVDIGAVSQWLSVKILSDQEVNDQASE